MSDEEKLEIPHDGGTRAERKFWGQPLKHISYGVGLSSLVWALTPYFQTKTEAVKETVKVVSITEKLDALTNTVEKGFANQNKIFLDHVTEETRVRETRIADEKTDRIRDNDSTNKRIDVVMELFKIKTSKTN